MGSPIRVLHAVVNMNRGGAETLLMNLYRNIDRTKIQFDFLTCKEGVFDQEIMNLGGMVHRIPYVTDVGHKGYIRELNKFFRANNQYKIIHSHMDKMSGIVLRIAKENNVPARIVHSHSTSSEGNSLAKLYKWYIGKEISISATHYLACSEKAAQWLFKANENDTRILKNGIEPETYKYSPILRKQVREELKLDDSACLIGHIGRFNFPKNHAFLLETFSKIAEKNKHAHLLLVGDGLLRKDLEKKVNKLNLSKRVIFTGVRSDIPRLLQGMDLFVFPSLYEGLPVTLIEAQGAGIPCIISDVITKEVDMGLGLVNFLPLNVKEQWIEKITMQINFPLHRNFDSASALIARGYDIKHTASWTEGFYLAM